VLSVRLPEAREYSATLRMDPFPRPLDTPQALPVVDVVLNGVPIASLMLQWTPERVGTYPLRLPRASVRRGANQLVLHIRRPGTGAVAPARPGLTPASAVGVWYLRVHAAAPSGSSDPAPPPTP
jgi:hypothetical protein